jgi:hypothetical protein
MEVKDAPHKNPGMNLKEKVLLSVVGVVAIGGTFYFANRAAQRYRSRKEQKKSLVPGSAADYATQIYNAMDGAGTDEESLRRILRMIPDKKTWLQVAASYMGNYHTSLTKDLQGDLSTTEYEEMMLIISSKPEEKKPGVSYQHNHKAWAKRLYAAMSAYYWIFPGTDEDAIKAVFLEIPTKMDFWKVHQEYKKEYGSDAMEDIKGELSQYYLDELSNIFKSKPMQ